MVFGKREEPIDIEEAVRKKIEPRIREELWKELQEKYERENSEKTRVENILNNVNTKNTYRRILIEKTINNLYEKSKTVKPSDLKEHYLNILEMLSDSSADHFDYFLKTFREKVKEEKDPSRLDNLMLKFVDVSKRASKADSGVEKFKIITEELLKKTLGMK